MNMESLRMFCDVVEQGSISKAARKGFVSQPAVTKQIRQLEDRYGAKLFDRSEQKLELTEAGSTLYPYAKEIIVYYQRSQEAIRQVIGGVIPTLNIGATLTIGEYILPEILEKYSRNNQDTKFNLRLGNTPDILSKLKDTTIDIALVEGMVDNDKLDDGLVAEKFSTDDLVLITPPQHAWSDCDEINLDEIADEKMIWRESSSGTRIQVETELKKYGVDQKIQASMEMESIQAIKNAVEAGLGVSIVPKITVRKELQYGMLAEVNIKDFHLTRDLYMVQRKTRFKKVGLQNFVSVLQTYLKELT
nr:LysR family transcriptional regulator [Aquibacillus sediminis]